MSEKELADLKLVLRSLVVSSPTTVDVKSLQRDYRNLVGGPLPLAKFGYKDPVTFFKERCGDCFLLQGMPSNPVLTLIVPESLKHIDKFVQKQKSTGVTKLKGKRTSIPERLIRNNNDNLITKTFHDKNVRNNSNEPAIALPNIDKLNITYKSHKKIPANENTPLNTHQRETPDSSTFSIDRHVLRENAHEQTSADTHGNDLQRFLKKRLPHYTSQNLQSDKNFSDKISPNDTDSGIQISSTNSNSKEAQLEELQREIYEIIKANKNGIWCMDLMKLYRERYKRDLNFTRLGFMSVVSVVKSMGERVRVSRPTDTGDWWLSDARAAPAPAPARAAPAPVARRPDPDPDDALPGIDFDPDVFPADCLHYVESIPPADLAGVRPGAMLPVIVGEVYSPSHFWLIRLGDAYNIAMEDIMDEMTAYYSSDEGKDRFLARGAVRVGHYCSSLYEGDWHRSLIVSTVDADHVKVRHVDYGTVETVARGALRPLRRQWARLPAQAVRARLAALRPPAAARRWTHAAALAFLARVKDRRLVANVVAVDEDEETVETFLVDTAGEDDVCVSQELIRAGHADSRPDSALGAEELYLRPGFDALEAGATPNLGEIDRFLRAGIALEYVESYRRHVPAGLPPSACAPPAPPASAASEAAQASAVQTQIPLLLPPTSPEPPPPAPRPPPPPPGGGEAGSIRLTATECQIYKMLCAMDQTAAQCYMTAAMKRAQHTDTPRLGPPPFGPPPLGPPPLGPLPLGPPPLGPPPLDPSQFGPPPFGPPYFAQPWFGPSPFGPPAPPPFGSPPFGPTPFGPPPGF